MAKDINWKKTYAAVWRGKKGRLRAVSDLDTIAMDDLLGIDTQKAEFRQNLEQFLDGRPRNHVLLWGARGTGKSSLVKAALNTYGDQKLRVVEVEKQDIDDLPEISDLLRELPWRFLLYCDDLTFEAGDPRYRYLKVLMEGSIERPPENILMMATSNRRHLVSEKCRTIWPPRLAPTVKSIMATPSKKAPRWRTASVCVCPFTRRRKTNTCKWWTDCLPTMRATVKCCIVKRLISPPLAAGAVAGWRNSSTIISPHKSPVRTTRVKHKRHKRFIPI